MSKIIKSHENDVLMKVKKFEKKILAASQVTARRPAESQPAMKPADPAQFVADAERKAGDIVLEAQKEAENLGRQACERGYAEGFAKGSEEGRSKFEHMLKTSSKLLESVVNQVKSQETEMMRLLSPRLADLAAELARRIIHRQIALDQTIVISQAEEAIKKILERDKLIIRVNPNDEKIMKEHKSTLISMFDGIDKIEVIGDPAIQQGGCVIETHLVKVDAQPESQLQAARKALVPDSER